MITFRPFRNSDPPQLAEIWRSQPPSRGLVQPMSAALFERQVLNASMFDREGLIVACEGGHLLGFVHAGFGPSQDLQRLSAEIGGTCTLMVRPVDSPSNLASELLARSEEYLLNRGAKTLFAGGVDPWGPFYLGITGGSACSIVLNSDSTVQHFYQSHNYSEDARAIVMHCDLAKFRPPIDRRQLLVRRRTNLQVLEDPAAETWWESSTLGTCDRTRFNLLPRDGGPPLADVTMWNMDLLGASWGIRAAGLTGLEVLVGSNRRQGLALYIVAEALRHFQALGMMVIEAQVAADNLPAKFLFEKLGFVEVDQAVRYRKR